MEKIIVYGAGQFGELIKNLIHHNDEFEISAYGDDSYNSDKKKYKWITNF